MRDLLFTEALRVWRGANPRKRCNAVIDGSDRNRAKWGIWQEWKDRLPRKPMAQCYYSEEVRR